MKKIISIIATLVGLLFIFSGFVKAVDPLGFSYKLVEYFIVFKVDWLTPTALAQSVLICAFEIFLGFTLVFHFQIKRFAWWIVGMILFFTLLTGVSAIFDVVKDCGCFGNAIPLTAWQSFYKDLILMVLTGLIFWKRNELEPFIKSKQINGILVYGSGAASILFSLWCLAHLPTIDFRAYKIGNNIVELINDGEPPIIEYSYEMKHKETDEIKIFPSSEYANVKDSYDLIKGISNIIVEEKAPSIEDFIITDFDGNEWTEDILSDPIPTLMILSKDLNQVKTDHFKDILTLANTALANNFNVIGVSPNSFEDTDEFRHEQQTAFPFYVLDEKVVKTIVRSNPGIILIKEGVILGKWHYNDTPDWSSISKQSNN